MIGLGVDQRDAWKRQLIHIRPQAGEKPSKENSMGRGIGMRNKMFWYKGSGKIEEKRRRLEVVSSGEIWLG